MRRGAEELQRAAQWRLDLVVAENSMGFHAPQEVARLLGESIDLSRQAQVKATRLAEGRSPPLPRRARSGPRGGSFRVGRSARSSAHGLE
jgi:hypothetical protein